MLGDDKHLTTGKAGVGVGVLPIDPSSMALFHAVGDGILLWCVRRRVPLPLPLPLPLPGTGLRLSATLVLVADVCAH